MAQGPTGTVRGRTKESRHPPRNQGWTRRRWEWRLATDTVTRRGDAGARRRFGRWARSSVGHPWARQSESRQAECATVNDHFAYLVAMALQETCALTRSAMIRRLRDEQSTALKVLWASAGSETASMRLQPLTGVSPVPPTGVLTRMYRVALKPRRIASRLHHPFP